MTTDVMSDRQFDAQQNRILKLRRNDDFGEVSNNEFAVKTIGNSPFGGEFTAKSLVPPISGGANLARNKRGGARNRADRQSESISAGQVENLIAAAEHAKAIGLPFNRMITIHWQKAGIPLERMVRATGEFIGLLTKALKRWGSNTTWMYVHEGGLREGGHCHMLVHVPAHLVDAVTKAQKRWLRSITGTKYRLKVIKGRPIGWLLNLEVTNPALHATNLDVAFSYLIKGANKQAFEMFGLSRLKDGGLVIGKRCGTSQNIGAKARARHGAMT